MGKKAIETLAIAQNLLQFTRQNRWLRWNVVMSNLQYFELVKIFLVHLLDHFPPISQIDPLATLIIYNYSKNHHKQE